MQRSARVVQGFLAARNLYELPYPFALSDEPLHAFAFLAQRDARTVARVLFHVRYPDLFQVHAIRALGEVAQYVSAARTLTEVGLEKDAQEWESKARLVWAGMPFWLKEKCFGYENYRNLPRQLP